MFLWNISFLVNLIDWRPVILSGEAVEALLSASSKNFSKIYYISGNGTFEPHIFLIFQEETLRARLWIIIIIIIIIILIIIIKTLLWKSLSYFRKWNFLVTRLETFFYFRRELTKPEKQKKTKNKNKNKRSSYISPKKVLVTFRYDRWLSHKIKKRHWYSSNCWIAD